MTHGRDKEKVHHPTLVFITGFPSYNDTMLQFNQLLLLLCVCALRVDPTRGFSIVLMAAKRGKKGGLQRVLNDDDTETQSTPPKSSRSLNQGRGQEITGVTLPAEGRLKGWEFGEGVRMVCANVNGKFFALQGECPRCGFDLWKGDLVVNDPGFAQDCLACPTCATTYTLQSGQAGPPLKRQGLAALVGNLAKTATADQAERNAKAFAVTRDQETSQVFLREK